MLAYVRARPRHRWLAVLLPWLVLLPLGAAGRALQAAPAAEMAVNTEIDIDDAVVGDGKCDVAPDSGLCSLRAALQEASANPGPDTIVIPAGTYFLSRAGRDDSGINGDLDISGTITLLGAGPASTIIDASTAGDRVLDVHKGSVTVAGVTIRGGAGTFGGGIRIREAASLTLTGTLITANSAGNLGPQGGGIFNQGTLTIMKSVVLSNTAVSAPYVPQGAGIMNAAGGTLIMHNTRVSGNNAPKGWGGGLYSNGQGVTVTNSTFSHNQAGEGGGLYVDSGDSAQLANTTISSNRATQAGGGVYIDGTNEVSLYNVTVTGNWANDEVNGTYTGGGLVIDSGMVVLRNSLVAGNLRTDWAGPFVETSDCAGTVLSVGPNYLGAADGCDLAGEPPLTGGFALLGPLADNGGPAPTHALLPGSPAIDAGAEAGCLDFNGQPLTHDQRGQPRPAFGGQATRCDLGAYERQVMIFLAYLQR